MKKVITAILFLITAVHSQKFIGDSCTDGPTGSPGECKLFRDCQPAIQALRERNVQAQRCGFQDHEPIICCTASSTSISTREAGKISREKCREFSKYVYVLKRPPIPIPDAEPTLKYECGHKAIELVVGGELSKRKEFPHMAVIGYEVKSEVKWYCGGSIISEEYILTAAHCLNPVEYGMSKYVRMGVTNLNSNDHMQQYNVIERIPHPDYKPPSHYNDIGLIKLDKRPTFNPYVIPACLYVNSEIDARKAIAIGFGKTAYAGESSDNLMKVTLDLIDEAKCNYSYRNQITRKLVKGVIGSIQVCAGSLDPEVGKDTCQGDSGGPLQIYHIKDDIKCMYDIVGVTSFGKACSGSPGVYTRVSQYIKWIEDIVWP